MPISRERFYQHTLRNAGHITKRQTHTLTNIASYRHNRPRSCLSENVWPLIKMFDVSNGFSFTHIYIHSAISNARKQKEEDNNPILWQKLGQKLEGLKVWGEELASYFKPIKSCVSQLDKRPGTQTDWELVQSKSETDWTGKVFIYPLIYASFYFLSKIHFYLTPSQPGLLL